MIDLAFSTIDNGCYSQYLGKCGLDVIIEKPGPSPATIYNRILDETKERYVCFIHSDVTCSGLERAIEHTIAERPGYLLGAVGVDGPFSYKWSRHHDSPYDIITADSCCIVVDKEMGLRFDDKTFDGLHLYVEDICMQAGKVSTMRIDAFDELLIGGGFVFESFALSISKIDFFIHHSYTLRQRGARWGDYCMYLERLQTKWPGVVTT